MHNVNFISIPFKIEAQSGLSEADGIAKFSVAGIILEFELKYLGLFGTGVKEVRLPLEEILDVAFKKGMFRYGTKIEIRMTSYLKLSAVPNKDGKIILKIPRDQHEQAREAVEMLVRASAQNERNLPPPQTPVARLFESNEAADDPLRTSQLESDEVDKD